MFGLYTIHGSLLARYQMDWFNHLVKGFHGFIKGDLPGTPNDGTPFMVSFLYYSHIFRDSYGSAMGIVWVPLTIFGGPMSLGVPENATDFTHGFWDPLRPSMSCWEIVNI